MVRARSWSEYQTHLGVPIDAPLGSELVLTLGFEQPTIFQVHTDQAFAPWSCTASPDRPDTEIECRLTVASPLVDLGIDLGYATSQVLTMSLRTATSGSAPVVVTCPLP